jgi:hypothetical protein
MQKVYLLLRSNKQTGPYSLEELLQLNPKPFDLVWVQGRSAAWQYPSEIPSLKPFVPETPHADVPFQPVATSAMEEKTFPNPEVNLEQQHAVTKKTDSSKRIFVSIPKTYKPANSDNYNPEASAFAPKPQPVYERKEEIKTASPSYSQPIPSGPQQNIQEDTRTNYSRSLNDLEEDYTSWVYKQKTKNKTRINSKDTVLAILILAVIGGGYYVMSKPSVANSVLPVNKPAAQTIQQPTIENDPEPSQKEIVTQEQTEIASTTRPANNSTIPSKNIKSKNPQTVSKTQTNSSVPQIQNSMPVEKTTPNILNGDNDVVTKERGTKKPTEESVSSEKKKKKLGEVIKGIFSKPQKKEEPKNDETVLQDPKPANNRQATRRGADDNASNDNAGANEISTTSLMEQVDISSNAPDNWMMGIKNLKVTLRNRNKVTLQTASVAVSYYDENNQLLEKKLIYFNNVASNAKATVSVPDHKFADHVDFRIMTVNAKEDRYASY